MSPTTRAKIKKAVTSVIPGGQKFTIYAEPTGFDHTNVIRVITPAWKERGKSYRIEKVHEAVMSVLEARERKEVFRFSVLTPDEWQEVRKNLLPSPRTRIGARLSRKPHC